MHKIDFNYMGSAGQNIFHACLVPIIMAERSDELENEGKHSLLMSKETIVRQTRENFDFLIATAAFHKTDISAILAKPNHIGDTAFKWAYDFFADDSIIRCLMKYNIEINFVNLNFETIKPDPEHVSIFLARRLNLKIIDRNDVSVLQSLNELNQKNSVTFPKSIQQIINILPNAVYFSPLEQKCTNTCKARCFT